MSRRLQVSAFACICLLSTGVAAFWYYHTSRPEYRLRQAQAAMRSGDLKAGEIAATDLEASGCRDEAILLRAEAYLLRAEAENRTDEMTAALALLNQLRPDSPRALEAATLSGRCLLRLGNLVEAERTLAYVLSQDEYCLDAHRGLMAVYYDLGALPTAMYHARAWADLAPRDGRPCRFLGLMHKDMANHREAIAPYRAALERELTERVRAEVSLELAQCLIRAGEFAKAETVLDASRPPADLLARVLTAQAECERALDRPESARELAGRALAADPKYTEALRISAQLALDADDPSRAARELERAATLAPNEYDTYHILGRAYARLGQPAKAQAAQERVKEIQDRLEEMSKLSKELMSRPKDAALQRKIADVFAQLNQPETAAARRRVAALLEQAPPSAAPSAAPPAPPP